MLQFIVPLFNDLMIWSMTEWNSLYNNKFSVSIAFTFYFFEILQKKIKLNIAKFL